GAIPSLGPPRPTSHAHGRPGRSTSPSLFPRSNPARRHESGGHLGPAPRLALTMHGHTDDPTTGEPRRTRSRSTPITRTHNPRPGGMKGRKTPPRLLTDMRAVYDQDESRDRTPGQRNCRQLLKADPQRFLAQLARLESAHKAVPKVAGEAGPTPKPGGAPPAA